MRRFRFAILVVLLTIPAPAFSGQFKIIKIYDGDTVKAAGHGVELKVRLAGIDAPETKKGKRKPGQPYSLKAKKFLTGKLLDQMVDIKGLGLAQVRGQLGQNGRNIAISDNGI